MRSRRKRKRYRSLAVNASLRGDRTGPPTDFGFPRGVGGQVCEERENKCVPALGGRAGESERGQLLGDWKNAIRGELLLLRKAIKEGWPVPFERRHSLMHAALAGALREGKSIRHRVAAAWVVIDADLHDLKLQEAERRAAEGVPAERRRVPVEACLALSAGGWGSLPRSGVWHLGNSGLVVGYSFDPARSVIQLHYTLRGSAERQLEAVAQTVQLEARPTRFGGQLWCFLCPLEDRGCTCNARVSKLYLPPGQDYFGCRHCHGLTYASRQVSRRPRTREPGPA
jgi:hypothetical protein